MDAEKDKPAAPEKSPPAPDKTENHETNDDKKGNDKSDAADQATPENQVDNASKDATDPPQDSADQTKSETSDGVEAEIKEEGDTAEPETQPEEETTPPPLDLAQVSEEIDQYMSKLPTLKSGGDDESTPLLEVPAFVEHFVGLVESRIVEYDSSEKPVRWNTLTNEDAASFLEAMTRLYLLSKALAQFLPTENQNIVAPTINRTEGVFQRAMSYLEEEFKLLLEDYKINDTETAPSATAATNDAGKTKQPAQNEPKQPPAQNEESEESPAPPEEPPPPPPPEEITYFPGYPEEMLSSLITLSRAMIAGDHEMECCQLYFVARRSALDNGLHKLGFEKHSIDDVQKMQWENLEKEIVAWIKTFKQCASVHFSSERKLSTVVFPDHPSISESIFCGLSHVIMIQLLNFAEAVALTKRAPEKLFKFLDIYESLRDILPTIGEFFPEEWMNEVKTEASIIKGRLGEALILIFLDLENSIKADTGKTPVPGGAVHPLTRYIMNYLRYACEYKDTLEQVFREHQKIERADSATGSDYNYNAQSQTSASTTTASNEVKQSPFQTQMTKVMDLLDVNLDSKSKLYRDHSLACIFMMNNGRYILQKIKVSTEMNMLLGDSWCRRRSSDIRQYHKGYQRETWGRLLSCFQTEGLISHGKVVKPVLKERFNNFNKMFDEIHRTQTSWVVCDGQLQSELRVSISNMVIPAYRSFLGRFSQTFTPGRQTEKYIKYQAEDIETYIDELFDGSAATNRRRL